MRLWVWLVLLVVLVLGTGGWIWHSENRSDVQYRTAVVHRGDMVSSINASGTLEPEEVVDVGAQVAGLIESFGKDSNGNPIDYRSPVEPNMVLARIDETVYKSGVDVARAQLEQAKTAIQKSEADLGQAKAKLLQAQHNWERAKTLGPSDALSQNDYDMYQADFETAKANVASAESGIALAKNGVPLAEAELAIAQRNLDFCTIVSPVKGVIIDRRVNVGQTVVSSLNTPSLFLIAKDLTRMQIWVGVNEADVGRIVSGMPVTFTCDAFPDRTFVGRVGKVRLNATMTQNVVMYTVEVEADNPQGILLPYLTAKVQFEVQRDSNVLIVPNLALRWVPTSPAQVTPADRAMWKGSDDGLSTLGGAPMRAAGVSGDAAAVKKEHHGTLWIRDGEFVRPVDVKLGATDRVKTAVYSDELQDGSEVVVGDFELAGDAASKNPFMPQPQRRF